MGPESAWIPVTPSLTIARDELVEVFTRASGPGGQHVNTTSTAVELRFDAAASPNLPERVKTRLSALAGRRMTRDGVIIVRADSYRSQQRNRDEALDRLLALLRLAAAPARVRRLTKPTLGSQKRRLAGKSIRSALKTNRRKDGGGPDG